MNTFISVIVPNYNHANFLKKRIDSILDQSYTNFELIILDDCSTDNSSKIIESYKNHPKVSQIIYNRINSGCLFLQWQKGIDLAKGEWIWIAESDDFSSPLFLEKLVERITKQTVLVYSNSFIVDSNDLVYSDSTQWLKDLSITKWTSDYTEDGNILFSNYWAYKNIVSNTSSIIFRKDIVSKLIFPSNFQYCGDWLFFAQFCFYGDIAYIAETLNYWRQHKQTTRNIFSLDREAIRLKENTDIIRIFRKFAKQNNLSINQRKYIWLVDRWLCLFTYKNIFCKNYITPPFPIKLKLVFYLCLLKRIFIEVFKSIKKRFF